MSGKRHTYDYEPLSREAIRKIIKKKESDKPYTLYYDSNDERSTAVVERNLNTQQNLDDDQPPQINIENVSRTSSADICIGTETANNKTDDDNTSKSNCAERPPAKWNPAYCARKLKRIPPVNKISSDSESEKESDGERGSVWKTLLPTTFNSKSSFWLKAKRSCGKVRSIWIGRGKTKAISKAIEASSIPFERIRIDETTDTPEMAAVHARGAMIPTDTLRANDIADSSLLETSSDVKVRSASRDKSKANAIGKLTCNPDVRSSSTYMEESRNDEKPVFDTSNLTKISEYVTNDCKSIRKHEIPSFSGHMAMVRARPIVLKKTNIEPRSSSADTLVFNPNANSCSLEGSKAVSAKLSSSGNLSTDDTPIPCSQRERTADVTIASGLSDKLTSLPPPDGSRSAENGKNANFPSHDRCIITRTLSEYFNSNPTSLRSDQVNIGTRSSSAETLVFDINAHQRSLGLIKADSDKLNSSDKSGVFDYPISCSQRKGRADDSINTGASLHDLGRDLDWADINTSSGLRAGTTSSKSSSAVRNDAKRTCIQADKTSSSRIQTTIQANSTDVRGNTNISSSLLKAYGNDVRAGTSAGRNDAKRTGIHADKTLSSRIQTEIQANSTDVRGNTSTSSSSLPNTPVTTFRTGTTSNELLRANTNADVKTNATLSNMTTDKLNILTAYLNANWNRPRPTSTSSATLTVDVSRSSPSFDGNMASASISPTSSIDTFGDDSSSTSLSSHNAATTNNVNTNYEYYNNDQRQPASVGLPRQELMPAQTPSGWFSVSQPGSVGLPRPELMPAQTPSGWFSAQQQGSVGLPRQELMPAQTPSGWFSVPQPGSVGLSRPELMPLQIPSAWTSVQQQIWAQQQNSWMPQLVWVPYQNSWRPPSVSVPQQSLILPSVSVPYQNSWRPPSVSVPQQSWTPPSSTLMQQQRWRPQQTCLRQAPPSRISSLQAQRRISQRRDIPTPLPNQPNQQRHPIYAPIPLRPYCSCRGLPQ